MKQKGRPRDGLSSPSVLKTGTALKPPMNIRQSLGWFSVLIRGIGRCDWYVSSYSFCFALLCSRYIFVGFHSVLVMKNVLYTMTFLGNINSIYFIGDIFPHILWAVVRFWKHILLFHVLSISLYTLYIFCTVVLFYFPVFVYKSYSSPRVVLSA